MIFSIFINKKYITNNNNTWENFKIVLSITYIKQLNNA